MNRLFTVFCASIFTALLFTPHISYSESNFESLWDKERFQIRVRAISVIADGDGSVKGAGLETDVENAVVPEVDFTYFFTKHIAAEAVVASSEHRITAGNADVGDAWILPPTLVLQYHFQPDEKFSPYIGAGVNYSIFYGENAGAGFSDLDVENGLGFALQAGFDYWINKNWGLNFDAKYIDLSIDASVNQGATELQTSDIDINPFILGAGISYRF